MDREQNVNEEQEEFMNTQQEEEVLQEEPLQEEVVEQNVETEEDYREKYFRMIAEMENQRKRLTREKSEANKYAVRGVIRDILQPFDSMENALKFAKQTEGEVSQWAEGFLMILDQFKEILFSHGVEPFTSVGTHFDPHKHEAIDTEEAVDAEDGMILEEYQKGYMMEGKTLRPAKVKVAKKYQEKKESEVEDES